MEVNVLQPLTAKSIIIHLATSVSIIFFIGRDKCYIPCPKLLVARSRKTGSVMYNLWQLQQDRESLPFSFLFSLTTFDGREFSKKNLKKQL